MKKKTVLTSLLLTLMMTVMIAFTGCGGGEPETLESYVADNPEKMEQVEATAAEGGMEVEVVENSMIYYYTFDQVLSEEEMQQVADEAQTLMDEGLNDKFTQAITDVREGSGVEEATLTIIFQDAEGTEVCSYEF